MWSRIKSRLKIIYASPLVVRNKEKMHIFLHNLTWFPLSRQIGLTWSAMLAGTLLAIVMMATSLCWKWLNFNCATLLSLLLIFINYMLKVSYIHGFSMRSFPLLFLTHQSSWPRIKILSIMFLDAKHFYNRSLDSLSISLDLSVFSSRRGYRILSLVGR